MNALKVSAAVVVVVVAIVASVLLRSRIDTWHDDREASLFLAALSGDAMSLHGAATGNGTVPLRDLRDRYGNTLLHWAAKGGHINLCAWLLEAPQGLNLHAVNNAGTPALHWAVYSAANGAKLIEILVERGANVNAANDRLETALHWAVEWDRPKSVAALLHAGAEPNMPDVNQDRPLHRIPSECTASMSCGAILKELLKFKADAAAVNSFGRMALAHLDWTSDLTVPSSSLNPAATE
ncbi:Ankyrin repeat domain-containing protein [Plasmodiophora brassicae]